MNLHNSDTIYIFHLKVVFINVIRCFGIFFVTNQWNMFLIDIFKILYVSIVGLFFNFIDTIFLLVRHILIVSNISI